MQKKCLVTGGAGFIGSHVVDALIAAGHAVYVIDNLSTGQKANIHPRATLYKADITSYTAIENFFEGMDVVFHLAALARIQPSIVDPLPSHAANVTGTLNVLQAARTHKVPKVIYSASSSVYGDQEMLPLHEDMTPCPKNPYAMQKLIGEQYCKLFSALYGVSTVCLRYFNVYGPRQLVDGPYATVVGIFLAQKAAGIPLTIVGTGEKRRDFTHVKDVVRANIAAWESAASGGEIINIGTGENFSINEVAALIGGPTVHIDDRSGESFETRADIRKAQRTLGWSPSSTFTEEINELKSLGNLV